MKNIISAVLVIGVIVVIVHLLYQDDPESADTSSEPAISRQTNAGNRGPILTIGSVSTKPKEEYAKFRPFAAYLTQRLRGKVQAVRVLVVSSSEELVDLLRRGEIDIYVDSPFSAAVAVQSANAVPWLRRWKRGRAEYHSVLFVRADSGIDSLNQLRGKVVAFDEPFSTSGFLLPKATISENNLELTEIRSTNAEVPESMIGYVFSEDDENTLFWVMRKKVAAGALSSAAFERFHEREKRLLKIIDRSISVPRQVVVHRANLPDQLKSAMEEVILNMESDQRGQNVLDDFESTTRFDRFTTKSLGEFEAIYSLIQSTNHLP